MTCRLHGDKMNSILGQTETERAPATRLLQHVLRFRLIRSAQVIIIMKRKRRVYDMTSGEKSINYLRGELSRKTMMTVTRVCWRASNDRFDLISRRELTLK